MKRLILALAFAMVGFAQTGGLNIVNGQINFGGATHTATVKVVANTGALPASGCIAGELAIVTGATLGQQMYQNSGTGTCVWTQQLNSGSATGGGITVYSGTALTVTANTYYIPIGGGGTPSTTETNVDVDSPSAATITNFYVQISVALGMGNTGVFTLRKNASSQSVTCTITGASATSCSDTTHSFNVSQGDLLTVQLVTTGTIVVTPNLLMAMQFGQITATGTVNTGTATHCTYYASSGAAVSDSGAVCPTSGTAAVILSAQSQANPWFLTPTTTRAKDTAYQNLTGVVVWVAASITTTATSSGANCQTDSSNPPTTVVAPYFTPTNNQTVTLTFPVLPNNYARCATSAGTINLNGWTEWK